MVQTGNKVASVNHSVIAIHFHYHHHHHHHEQSKVLILHLHHFIFIQLFGRLYRDSVIIMNNNRAVARLKDP